MTLILDNEQRRKLRDALMSAFPNQANLERVVDDKLGISLNTIADSGNYTDIIFNLIKWANSQGRAQDLIEAAYEANSRNPELKEFIREINYQIPNEQKETPEQQIDTPQSRYQSKRPRPSILLQIDILKQDIDKLEKDYEAVAEKKRRGNNPQEENNLQLQLNNIAKQIEEKEQQLEKLRTLTPKMTKVVINHSRQTAQYFIEELGNGVELEIVLIPGGSFLMGSPEEELGRRDDESPQHLVTVKTFSMGKYPVTQAQWRAVASFTQVNRELKPDPSGFKGDNRPVEQVSWYDCIEFCDRLSNYTKRTYRLPSEAEWEYTCRAGTTTPFHFGETISTDLANYRGTNNEEYKLSGSYGKGNKGIYRKETTPVGSFGVANAFGLYDMHGQVWEWCADHWHESYEGAPTDGEAWIDLGDNNQKCLQRGGSWYFYPVNCRSACRTFNSPDVVNDDNDLGFRVVCVVLPRTK